MYICICIEKGKSRHFVCGTKYAHLVGIETISLSRSSLLFDQQDSTISVNGYCVDCV